MWPHTAWGDPGIQALGQGHPQTGHPGHLPGCACAPAARLRPLTSRLRSAVPGKADYAPALQLSFSPASPPAQLQCLARPGGTRGPLAEGGGHGRSKSSFRLCTSQSIPSWGMSGPQNPKRNLTSNSIPLPQSLPGEPGVGSHPTAPHPWWVLSPSPGCGAEKRSLGKSLCSTAPPNPPGQQ